MFVHKVLVVGFFLGEDLPTEYSEISVFSFFFGLFDLHFCDFLFFTVFDNHMDHGSVVSFSVSERFLLDVDVILINIL